MSAFTLPIRLRLGALVLLASILPLVVQAPAPASTVVAARPAVWLRAQVGGEASPGGSQAAFQRALAAAEAADARTLHGFLASFLDAHARVTHAERIPTQGRSTHALVQELRRQLMQAGLVVHPLPQASAPPVAPQQRARWLAATPFVPLPDRFAAAERHTLPLVWERSSMGTLMQRAAVPVARGALARMLFAGRRLGP